MGSYLDRRHFEAWTRERRTVACAGDCSSLVVASDACRTTLRARQDPLGTRARAGEEHVASSRARESVFGVRGPGSDDGRRRARGSPRARATRTSPPRRALRQIALERDAEAYDFYELAPGASGSAPTYWLLRDALEEIPAEAARASEVRAATFADAARRLVGAWTFARARRPFRSPRRGSGPLGPRHFPRRRLSFRSSRERRKKRASSVPSPHTRARSRRPPRAANHGRRVLPHASASFRARERLALALGSPRRLARPERLRESDGRRRGAPPSRRGRAPARRPRRHRHGRQQRHRPRDGARARARRRARRPRVPRSHRRRSRRRGRARREPVRPRHRPPLRSPRPRVVRSVRAFADAFLALELPLHILVHNAGIMPCPFQLTADGHELAFQVNYLSPRLLTARLLPRLRRVDENDASDALVSPAASSTSSPPRTSTPTRAACV